MPRETLDTLGADPAAARRLRPASSPPTACSRARLAAASTRGTRRSSTRPRRSRTPAPRRPRAVKELKAAAPRRPHRHARREPPVATSGRSSTSSTPACSARPKAFGASSSSSSAAAQRRYAPLRTPRPPVHPAAAEDRQARHRRPARQDRGEGLLRLSKQQAALYEQRSSELADATEGRRRASSAAGVVLAYADAAQADLQPPRAAGCGDGALRAGATAASSRGWREICEELAERQEKAARLHAVPRDHRAAGRASSPASSADPGLVLHGGTPVAQAPASSSTLSSATTARRSSSSRSRPAAPA